MIRILFIGDIIAKYGRVLVRNVLPAIKEKYQIDLVIGNGENAAHGNGLTTKTYKDLIEAGVDVITSGNHIFDKREFLQDIDKCEKAIRPANYPPEVPGKGYTVVETPQGVLVGVLCLMGRVFMPTLDNPFTVGRALVEKIRRETPVIFVDIHAEATSEKVAMGWYLDGKVSAVVGTHTHVQTAYERILPNGTAYLSDAGMTGPLDSVIGVQIEPIVKRYLHGVNYRFEAVTEGPGVFSACVIGIDEESGRAHEIRRIYEITNPMQVEKEGEKKAVAAGNPANSREARSDS